MKHPTIITVTLQTVAMVDSNKFAQKQGEYLKELVLMDDDPVLIGFAKNIIKNRSMDLPYGWTYDSIPWNVDEDQTILDLIHEENQMSIEDIKRKLTTEECELLYLDFEKRSKMKL